MKNFLSYFLFFLVLYQPYTYSHEDVDVLKDEERDLVTPAIKFPSSTRQILTNLNYLRNLPDFDSKSSLAFIVKPTPAITYAFITEKEHNALKAKERYNQLVRNIKDRTINDEELFLILFEEVSKGTILDDMHKLFKEKSLAEVLMKVTRPYEWVYQSRGIIESNISDKSRTRFRYLGNDIYSIDLKRSYKNIYIRFKHSKLEMKFKIYSYHLNQTLRSLSLKHPYTEDNLKSKNLDLDKSLNPLLKDLLKEEPAPKLGGCVIS